MTVPAPHIVTCKTWGAKPPKHRPTVVGRPDKALVHHTDGHHPEIANPANESAEEAFRYAREIQALHMGATRGWADSGHNFLVCRNGLILQGRWGSVAAIEHGRMVESAHCPGENGNPGVEFEHIPGEQPTRIQESAGIALYAWIFDRCHIPPTRLYGHKDFYATACPDALYIHIHKWRGQIASVLNHYGRSVHPHGTRWDAKRAVRHELKSAK